MILIYLHWLVFLIQLCSFHDDNFLDLKKLRSIIIKEYSQSTLYYQPHPRLCASQQKFARVLFPSYPINILIINLRNMKKSPLPNAQNLLKVSPPNNKKQSLLIEIKIKNKPVSNLLITDVRDAEVTQSQIKSFLAANSLKHEALDYIRSIVNKKINAKKTLKPSTATYQPTRQQLECNRISFIKYQKENSHAIPSSKGIRQSVYQKNLPSMLVTADTQSTPKVQDSFVFHASFSLPSSIADQDKSFVTDQMFQNQFNTGTFSSDFSTANEMNPSQAIETKFIYPTPSIKTQQSFLPSSTPGEASNAKRRQKSPIKIILNKKSVRTDEKKVSTLNSVQKNQLLNNERQMSPLSAKERKNAITASHKRQLEEDFQIYSNNKSDYFNDPIQVQGCLLTQQCLPLQSSLQSREESLLILYGKLTKSNPPKVRQIHSRYVSYQELTKEQLFLMGTLFERIDPQALNHLDYNSFRFNAFKYCRQEIQALHKPPFYQ